MLRDFHIHTDFSGDSNTLPYLQIERAIALGMEQICITDHHDFQVQSDIDFTLNFDSYFSALITLREQYKSRIQIEIGVELGLQCRIKEYLDTLSGQYPFDFIIGSCHFIDGIDPYFPIYYEGRSERASYERFFECCLKRVETIDCFDSYGHLDYVVRYGPNQNRDYRFQDYQELIDPILKTLIHRGKALECNTGGYRYKLGHPNPCEDILKRYRELGGELITVGSDAHTPEYLGCEFDRTAQILKDCGFRYYTVYHQRKPEFLPI